MFTQVLRDQQQQPQMTGGGLAVRRYRPRRQYGGPDRFEVYRSADAEPGAVAVAR
ncbi:hypothetical protein [Nocardia donostiensis]|uniref:hypothetical protein n=1 Tax=Nocardia donostiensis TaxID=1538463 RepID=UPI00159378AD|nr:hypothetical protein [Nocardia donostiensis]